MQRGLFLSFICFLCFYFMFVYNHYYLFICYLILFIQLFYLYFTLIYCICFLSSDFILLLYFFKSFIIIYFDWKNDNNSKLTTFVGTADYVSPEILQHKPYTTGLIYYLVFCFFFFLNFKKSKITFSCWCLVSWSCYIHSFGWLSSFLCMVFILFSNYFMIIIIIIFFFQFFRLGYKSIWTIQENCCLFIRFSKSRMVR